VVDGDDVHLFNIISNLLDNACKYSEGPPQVRISTELASDRLRLRVADRGIGLDEADRKRVFERYYRVASGDRHDVKGFGLGLAYVKLVVEAMGGTVRINSTLGKGTEVTVDLPLSRKGERQDD
jgi:two-component system phosphate regulon sensor histidine kinase PhoR